MPALRQTRDFIPGLGTDHGLSDADMLHDEHLFYTVHQDFQAASGSLPTPWGTQDTSAAGSPTLAYVADAADGRYRLLCDSTSEAQNLTLYHADQRVYDITKIRSIRMGIKLTVDTTAAELVLVAGLAGDRNATLDDIAVNAWFRLQASSALLVEADDGTTDSDDKATGQTWTTGQYKHLRIDIEKDSNNRRVARFYVWDTSLLAWRGCNQALSLNAATGNVQPYIELQRASGVRVHGVDVDYVTVLTARNGA